MAIRVVQYAPDDIKEKAAPQLSLEKHFMLKEWGIQLDGHLDRQWYDHGMPIIASIRINNRSSRIVRKIQVTSTSNLNHTRPLLLFCLVYSASNPWTNNYTLHFLQLANLRYYTHLGVWVHYRRLIYS